MQPKAIPANRPVDWYVQAWGIFKRDPAAWVVMVAIMLMGSLLLSLLPVIGMILLLLLMPGLVAGLLFAAREAVDGRAVKVEYLWRVLADGQQRGGFLLLGAVMFGAVISLAVISAPFVGDSLLRSATTGLPGFGVGGLLFLLAVGFASFAVFNYTPAVMLFRQQPVFEALKQCVSTVATYVIPVLIFFLLYAVGSSIASIPFGLGLLVFIPLTVIALYLSYRDMFGAPVSQQDTSVKEIAL